MRSTLGILGLLALAGATCGSAVAGPGMVGTWSCYPLKEAHSADNHQVFHYDAHGMVVMTTNAGTHQVHYTYTNGTLSTTILGETLKTKIIWKNANAFDTKVSEPHMEDVSCTRTAK